MKKYIFGYGSLINLESASRTLKRTLFTSDVETVVLSNYSREWNLFDDVFSSNLDKQVNAVFLNITPNDNGKINGLAIGVSDEELEYLKIREKNYLCVDVSEYIKKSKKFFKAGEPFQVFTFVGKKECLTTSFPDNRYFVFSKYISIVENGVSSFGKSFKAKFIETTGTIEFPIIDGDYSFINTNQQNAR